MIDKDDSKGVTLDEFKSMDENKDGSIYSSEVTKAIDMAHNGRLIGDKQDGVIGHYGQRDEGDCWLLSSIREVIQTEEGRKAIKDINKDNGNGTYTVNFPGLLKAYIVTEAELNDNKASDGKRLSDGDIDVRIFEIAFGKYRLETDGSSIWGGNLWDVARIFIGLTKTNKPAKELDAVRDLHGDANVQCLDVSSALDYLNTYDRNRGRYLDWMDIAGHAYSIKDVNPSSRALTLVNPYWVNGIPETHTYDEFQATGSNCIQILDNMIAYGPYVKPEAIDAVQVLRDKMVKFKSGNSVIIMKYHLTDNLSSSDYELKAASQYLLNNQAAFDELELASGWNPTKDGIINAQDVISYLLDHP